jgi:hypothetical protein
VRFVAFREGSPPAAAVLLRALRAEAQTRG